MWGRVMTYKVFICHAYDHQDIYFSLVQKLNKLKFDWRNQSVQYDMRYGDENEQLENHALRELIAEKISDCDVMLALTKPVASRRAWLQWEIKRAKELCIPVIGIARFRNDRTSKFVRDHADEIVDTWRIDHITNAIEILADQFQGKKLKRAQAAPPVQPAPPDEEVVNDPSPIEAPAPSAVASRVDTEVDEASRAVVRPKAVLFQDLGKFVPGPRVFPVVKEPRWWHRISKSSQ